jgi:hypothetical protein
LHQDTVWFVTRLKSNSCYEAIQEQSASGPVLADQVIRLSSPKGQACYPEPLRRVHYRDPETGQEYAFLTNRLAVQIWISTAFLGGPVKGLNFQVLLDLDRLPAAGMGQLQDQGGLGTPGTHSPGPKHAPGTYGFVGFVWSSSTRQPATLVIQLACRTAVDFVSSYLKGVPVSETDHEYYQIDNGESIKIPNPHSCVDRLKPWEFKNTVLKAGLTLTGVSDFYG